MTGSEGRWYDGYSTWEKRGIVEGPGEAGDPTGSGPGPLGQYVLNVDISDTIAPRILDVSRFPEEGGTTDEVIASFQVTTSETLAASTVRTPASYAFQTHNGHTYVLANNTMYWLETQLRCEDDVYYYSPL